jgi:hypothetical protein
MSELHDTRYRCVCDAQCNRVEYNNWGHMYSRGTVARNELYPRAHTYAQHAHMHARRIPSPRAVSAVINHQQPCRPNQQIGQKVSADSAW